MIVVKKNYNDKEEQNLIKELEFKTLDSVQMKRKLEEFIEVLKLLKERSGIKKIEIIVSELRIVGIFLDLSMA